MVLGGGDTDLVAHAQGLQEAFVQLRDWVEETAGRLEERIQLAERRIDGCVAYTSLVRYDAYNEMSGQQSSSVALLDAHGTGVVVSSILHRDQARVYVKQVHEGASELELSPEELEAIETAMAGAARRRRRGHEGRLPRARGHLQRGGAARLRPGRGGGGALRHRLRDGDGRSGACRGPRRRADRERSGGRRGGHARRLGRRGRPGAHRRRGGPPDPPLRRRGPPAPVRRGDPRGVPPPGQRPVRPLPARAAARTRTLVTAPSTADAVPHVRNAPEPSLALGSRLAAELYDCRCSRRTWRTAPTTSPASSGSRPPAVGAPGREGAKTSIVFWGAGDESPGWLVEVLGEFADRGVNLTRIESRPRRMRLGHYMFFADLEGAAEAAPGERGPGRAAPPGGGDPRARLLHQRRRAALARLARTVGANADADSQPRRVTPNQALSRAARRPAGLRSAVGPPAGSWS